MMELPNSSNPVLKLCQSKIKSTNNTKKLAAIIKRLPILGAYIHIRIPISENHFWDCTEATKKMKTIPMYLT